jgi:hypothetical protein
LEIGEKTAHAFMRAARGKGAYKSTVAGGNDGRNPNSPNYEHVANGKS